MMMGSLKKALNKSFSTLREGHPIQCAASTFFDMKHSNNAARIRLWLKHRPDVDTKLIKTVAVGYSDLKSKVLAEVNPTKKVPALIRHDGETVFDASVILNYLEDEYARAEMSFKPDTPKERQKMDLIIRCHDLYIASPNSTQPVFTHSQGSLYLAPYKTPFCHKSRCSDRASRSKKIAELWNQLEWLESYLDCDVQGGLVGGKLSLADFTWFPTTAYLEFILPRVFGWPNVFQFGSEHELPKFSKWWKSLVEIDSFAAVRDEILTFLEEKYMQGQFDSILREVADDSYAWTYPLSYLGSSMGNKRVKLNYQVNPAHNKKVGRYIAQEDRGDLVDEVTALPVVMHNARHLSQPNFNHMGFTLIHAPSAMSFDCFIDNIEQVQTLYYKEIAYMVKKLSGATSVFCFDHTVRESGITNLNAACMADKAAPVPRVHCDYTIDGAPRRLLQLGNQGKLIDHSTATRFSKLNFRLLAEGRYSFINVWRSIDTEHPVCQSPLAVCDERSIDDNDKLLYYLKFPKRTGENYSLRHSRRHKWWYYPHMTHEEALVFKVYDKQEHGPQFVFHTAFDHIGEEETVSSPPRKSVEVRAIAFF